MSPIFTCKTVHGLDIAFSLHDINTVTIDPPFIATIQFRNYDDPLHYSLDKGCPELLFAAFIKYKEFEAEENIKQLAKLYTGK